MTDNSKLVLNFLKQNFGKEFTKQEIMAELNIPMAAITGSINGLKKKGYAVDTHVDTIVVTEGTETRKEQTKSIPYHTLTEAGLTYDPDAEEAALKEEKARKAAEKAAARAAKE